MLLKIVFIDPLVFNLTKRPYWVLHEVKKLYIEANCLTVILCNNNIIVITKEFF